MRAGRALTKAAVPAKAGTHSTEKRARGPIFESARLEELLSPGLTGGPIPQRNEPGAHFRIRALREAVSPGLTGGHTLQRAERALVGRHYLGAEALPVARSTSRTTPKMEDASHPRCIKRLWITSGSVAPFRTKARAVGITSSECSGEIRCQRMPQNCR